MAMTHRASPYARKSSTLTCLARLLGIQRKHCLTCGTAEQPDFSACITPGCKGFYCSECYTALNNTCSVCMAPLSYPDSGNEEMDSSDEETPGLWLGAVRALRGQERGRLLRQRIREMIRNWRFPSRMATWLQARLEEKSEERNMGSSGVADKDRLLCSKTSTTTSRPRTVKVRAGPRAG